LNRLITLDKLISPGNWKPIETAPKNNIIPLYLAHFNEDKELIEIDFDGIWQCESESWEIPEVYYFWASANGIEDPTHWSYMYALEE
jgi:hypothetical protein